MRRLLTIDEASPVVASTAIKPRDRNDELAIAHLLRPLNASDDLAPALLGTVRAATRLSNARRAVLLLVDEAGTAFVEGASYSGGRATILPASGHLDDCVIAFFQSKHTVLVPGNIAVQRFARSFGLGSGPDNPVLTAALRDGDLLVGILLLEFAQSLPPDVSQNRLLALFLEQAATAIRKTRALHQLRRQVGSLSSVVSLDEALTRMPSFEDMLGQIIEQVRQLVGAEAGGVMLRDPATNELVMQKPALGANEDLIRLTRLPLDGGGNSVNVFNTGQPYISNDAPNDPAFLHRFTEPYGLRKVLTVPLNVNGERIGILVLNNCRTEFSDDDLRLLRLLSAHLGPLIQNARLLEEKRQTIAKLEEMNRVIDRQREGLQRTLAIHDRFTQMVLDGHGFGAIVASLSQLLANPVALEDRFANLVAHYPPDDQSQADEGWLAAVRGGGTPQAVRDQATVAAMLGRLEQERRPLRIPAIPSVGFHQPRVLAPVVVGREILAIVHVLECNRNLDDLDLIAMERAANAIALQMMKEKAAAEAQYKLRADLVTELLSGSFGPDELLLSRATYLGIDLRVPRAVLVLDVDGSLGVSGGTRRAEELIVSLRARLLDVVSRACGRTAPKAVVSVKGDEIIVLATVVAAGATDHADLRKLSDHLRAEVRRWLPEISVSVGIGSTCQMLADYARSYQQARRVLDVIKASARHDRTLAFDELGIYGVLFDPHNRDKLVSLVADTLGGLLGYDRGHGTQLAETLDQYLAHDCHLEHTAAAMCVHLSTLRYRLKRIEQVSGFDLHNVEAKFNLQLAFRVLRTVDPR